MLLKLSTRETAQYEKMKDPLVNPSGVVLVNYYEWEYTSIGNDPGFEGVVDYVNQRQIPLYVINGSSKESKILYDKSNPRYDRVEVISFPTFYVLSWLHDFKNRYGSDDIQSSNFNTRFDKPFISLNNKPHWHRCVQMDMLAKHDLIKHGSVSWNSWEGDKGRNLNQDVGYTWKYWKPELLVLDEIEDNKPGWTTQLPQEYRTSFLHLISETTVNAILVSEKTVPALMFCKVFLISSAAGYYKTLKTYGIEPYDEIFDYSFDDVEDIEKRFDMIAENVNRIKNYTDSELREIYQMLLPKLIRNKRAFIKMATDISLWPSFVLQLCEQESNVIKNESIYHYYQQYKNGPIIL